MAVDLFEMMEEDTENASKVSEVNTEGLKTVAEMANAALQQARAVENLELDLKRAKQKLLKLTDEDLPALLAEIGLPKFELDDGTKVEVKDTYGAHINEENKPKAYAWLRDNDFGSLIKNTVTASFGKGDDADATALVELAQENGFPVVQTETIHAQTLKAFVKELVEDGTDFPTEAFGLFVGQRATIKPPKLTNTRRKAEK